MNGLERVLVEGIDAAVDRGMIAELTRELHWTSAKVHELAGHPGSSAGCRRDPCRDASPVVARAERWLRRQS